MSSLLSLVESSTKTKLMSKYMRLEPSGLVFSSNRVRIEIKQVQNHNLVELKENHP